MNIKKIFTSPLCPLFSLVVKFSYKARRCEPWYFCSMVAQNTLRTCELNQVFFLEKC